jgi:hypothetical protein
MVDLSLRFLKDYGNELSRISLRLTGIIRTLVFTEREYAKFLDMSIEGLETGNRDFNDSLASEMGEIHKAVSEAMVVNDPENLLGLVIDKIDALFSAVQRKKQEDEERLGALKVEKRPSWRPASTASAATTTPSSARATRFSTSWRRSR